ncbi:MAG: peroxiredoxin [Alphaproteobacteria bacterium]|nr:peroxiredoxin [Alphaproteobacteria bacterium]
MAGTRNAATLGTRKPDSRSTAAGGAVSGLAPADKAPAFRLALDTGENVSLASLKGQPFVLYFYPRDDTPGCTREALDFSAAQKKFDRLGVKVIGVSKDSLESHEKFRRKHKLTVALGSDPETSAALAWGVWGEKTLYGRKFMGMERATFLVDAGGRIVQAWRKVKVPGHVEAVLDAAKALL